MFNKKLIIIITFLTILFIGTLNGQETIVPTHNRFIPIIRKGGQNLQSIAMTEASNALRGQRRISRGTLLHESTHMLNAHLDTMIGGNQLTPSKTYCAFYFWDQDQYLLVPTAGFAKVIVANRVPQDTISQYTFNTYFGRMYATRDAIHIVEDFNAELNGFEPDSPELLRDMLIYSLALGLEMDLRDHEKLQQYQAADKLLIELACKKAINLSAFRRSMNPKALALRNYLLSTYGHEWTQEVLHLTLFPH
jgi:hypothetical protein